MVAIHPRLTCLLTTSSNAEIAAVFPEPYLCFYPCARPSDVEAAQAFIHEIIEEEGPFDGIIGFSQGAALAASLILEDKKTRTHGADDLFKFAVFAGASLPFNKDDRTGLSLWEDARAGTTRFKDEFAGEVDTETPLGFPQFDQLADGILSRYHPQKNPSHRIEIPTLHIIGKQDRYAPQSRILAQLCNGQDDAVEKIILEHDDDHRMPRSVREQDKIARAIMLMIDRAMFRC